jgi:fucose 4-O-acetylase-like acetyltransferase
MQKDNTITIAKAIAIILMVLGHTWVSDYVNNWVGWFHMPLFFVMSGLCFKDENLASPRTYIKKKVKGLYVPYVKWCLIFLLLHNVFWHLNIYNDVYGFNGVVSHYYTASDYIKHAVKIVTQMFGHEQLLGGYWFMEVLFTASIGLFFYLKLLHKVQSLPQVKYGKTSIQLVWVILLIITVLASLTGLHIPYFGIGGRQLLAMSFMYSGYVYRKHGLQIHASSRFWWVPLGGFLLISSCAAFLAKTNMLSFDWKDVVPYYLIALCGTLMTYFVSHQLNRCEGLLKRFLVYTGNHTLTILTWHFLCFKIVSFLIIQVYGLPIQRLAEFPVIQEYSQSGWFLAYLIVGVGVPLGLARVKWLR